MQNQTDNQAGARTQVERDYLAGKWVPSYYGNKFTVANRNRSDGEQDLSFKVTTLIEAKEEAIRRNLIADVAQAIEEIGEDELERFAEGNPQEYGDN
jgi:hypothetical protein